MVRTLSLHQTMYPVMPPCGSQINLGSLSWCSLLPPPSALQLFLALSFLRTSQLLPAGVVPGWVMFPHSARSQLFPILLSIHGALLRVGELPLAGLVNSQREQTAGCLTAAFSYSVQGPYHLLPVLSCSWLW